LIHLLWYANELKIEGIVSDRWDAEGLKACELAFKAYAQDFKNYNFKSKKYPKPSNLKKALAKNQSDAEKLFDHAASKQGSPLYVLVWGNMVNFKKMFLKKSNKYQNIRLITVGTGWMVEAYNKHMPEGWPVATKPCLQPNWNGEGRKEIYENSAYNNLWWLEINSTYEGMFTGSEPKEMYIKLSNYGSLGRHMKEVTKNQEWAKYFRVGDTPSVLYLIDPANNIDDPTKGSWAGQYEKPIPYKPHYYTDTNGEVEWDYETPCNTWKNHPSIVEESKKTLEVKRPMMYASLLDKLSRLYREQN
jgi:hypothetical protein